MQRPELRWAMPGTMVTLSIFTALATTHHALLVNVLLDSTTGLLASACTVLIVARLLLAPLSALQRLAWQIGLAVLLLVALAELCEPFSEAAEQRLAIDNIDDLMLLGIAPAALWLFARFEVVPVAPQRWIFGGFVLQAVAMVLDFYDDGSGAVAARVSNGADLAQALSMLSYLTAVAWVVLDIRRDLMDEDTAGRRTTGAILRRPIRDRLYPPPFIFQRDLPQLSTPAGRVHRLCNDALWSSRDLIGSLSNVFLIASWPAVASARSAKAIRTLGGRVQHATGKTRLEQFLEQIVLAVHHRIPPIYYYVYELYKNGKRWPVGQYLMRYETKEIAFRLLYPAATEHSVPTPLKNKAEFAQHCARHGLRHVPTVMVFDQGERVPEHCLSDRLPARDVFIKPVLGKGGTGSERWYTAGRAQFRNMRGHCLSESELLDRVAELSRAERYLIQHAERNHPDIADLGAGALSTVRMVTFRNEKGWFEVTNAAFRMSVDRRSAVDNFHAGGIAANISLRTGELGFATDMGRLPSSCWYEEHPLTRGRIEGRRLPMWQEAVSLGIRAHQAFADYALVGWDIAILEDGPCLIEGNRGPDIDILQRTADRPIGNGRFGELLAWNLEQKLARDADQRRCSQPDPARSH